MKERSKGICQWLWYGRWELFTGRRRVKKGLDGWPQALMIFGSLVDGFNIGYCAWLVYQLVCGWARSAISEAVGFGVGSLPTTFKPPSSLLGINRIKWKPVFCFSGTRSMASFQGSSYTTNLDLGKTDARCPSNVAAAKFKNCLDHCKESQEITRYQEPLVLPSWGLRQWCC